METVAEMYLKQEAVGPYLELQAWAERHLEAEEGPGETDRPEYIELRAILAKLPK
jgi:hypothetical protein